MNFPLVLLLLTLCATFAQAQEPVSLISSQKPDAGWIFNNGQEFKGATGSLTADTGEQREGRPSLKLVGDFTQGGKYVSAGRKIDKVDVRELSFWLRSADTEQLTLRINDATGQTHQLDVKLDLKPEWQHLVLPLERFFARRGQADAVTTVTRYESWGGAKDGRWHGPATALYVLATERGQGKVRTVWFSDISILPLTAAHAVVYESRFSGPELPAGWQVTEGVTLDANDALKTGPPLRLARVVEKAEQPISATSPSFAARPGRYELSAVCKASLTSPDSSYNGVVTLEALGAQGQVLERVTVADLFGQHPYEEAEKSADLPAGTATARFHVQMNKTWGDFRVASLKATYLSAPSEAESPIARVLFTTAQLGNLLFPYDPRTVQIAVEAKQPLPESARTLTCVVRDYWGAEQGSALSVPLGAPEKKNGRSVYPATVDLAGVPLEIGRYYELHASIATATAAEPFTAQTSFAILPEAGTKKYKPEEIPFTSRNWDNRITEYIKLTDRLGIRVCGLWGGWDAKPPYAARAPQLDLVRQLGMGWLTNTPAAEIERGKTEYDEAALRQGVHNLIEKFGRERPLFVNLGNEPHGTGERVLKNVAAYRALYEEIKKTDPSIPVIATSVEPNEEYFQAGYGKYCDAFDFHIYETHDAVRRTIGEYQALMRKYNCVKPIYSTELGLNSQGQTRLAVAQSLTKKFATFFAAGGTSASWFGLLYPDPEGKQFGNSGDSHNVFDCRYNHYAPRLDAVAYYHAVNAIGAKKFVEEKRYADGLDAVLFRDRDGRSLQVLWSDAAPRDVVLPLAGVEEVEVIRVDGSHRTLHADGREVMLTVSDDPLLVLYKGGDALPEQLASAPVTIDMPTKALPPDRPMLIEVNAPEEGERVSLLAPAGWSVQTSWTAYKVMQTAASAVREADFTVRISDEKGRVTGELYRRLPLP